MNMLKELLKNISKIETQSGLAEGRILIIAGRSNYTNNAF